MGRFLVILTLVCALLGGAAMYYLQVYGYYRTLPAQSTYDLAGTPVAIRDFRGIDSESSPLRYRACFTLAEPAPDLPLVQAEPLNAPSWFDCFDAGRLGADLAAGTAQTHRIAADTPWGFDRVLALYPDGRAYVWPQVNACGAAHFDGQRLPAGCTPPPAR